MRTLSGAQSPLRGTLTLEGKDLLEITPRERARSISIVFTDTFPNGLMDVYAFTALGRHPYSGWFGGLNSEDHRSIANALNAAGATDLQDRQVSELSDGERQRVAIARALAQEARLMLLDEPTAFLDLPRRIELMRMLRDLAHREQIGMLLSTHDLDLALRFADRLWLIAPDGQLIQGVPEGLAFNDQLGSAFASDDLDWDKESGSFRPHRHPHRFCSIKGDGLVAVWTRRCLERHGFGIQDESKTSIFKVEIETTAKSHLWIIRNGDTTKTFNSLEALNMWLNAESGGTVSSRSAELPRA